jgi:hypothetical protein
VRSAYTNARRPRRRRRRRRRRRSRRRGRRRRRRRRIFSVGQVLDLGITLAGGEPGRKA